MRRRAIPDARAELIAQRGKFVRIAGEPAEIGYETGPDPLRNDHVWVTIRAGRYGRLRIAINTFSLINFNKGFDGQVRIGIARETCEGRPEPGVFACAGFDYAKIEADNKVSYELCVQERAQALIAERVSAAVFIEAWGDLYARNGIGIHQVHSRRSSCAVPLDITGRDGAVRFHSSTEPICETMLFKFCGQP